MAYIWKVYESIIGYSISWYKLGIEKEGNVQAIVRLFVIPIPFQTGEESVGLLFYFRAVPSFLPMTHCLKYWKWMLYKFFFNAEYAEKLLWIQSHLFFQLSELRNAEENPYGFLESKPHFMQCHFQRACLQSKNWLLGKTALFNICSNARLYVIPTQEGWKQCSVFLEDFNRMTTHDFIIKIN